MSPDRENGVIHTPVLLKEVISYLNVRPGGVYVDCTLGDGGYSYEILKLLGDGRLVSLDVDPVSIEFVKKTYPDEVDGRRWTIVYENFSKLSEVVRSRGIESVDGVVFDLGMSSRQIDADPLARGFTYLKREGLDMRMDPRLGVTAEDLLRALNERQIYEMFQTYGEERFSKRIAKSIVLWRRDHPDEHMTAESLAELIRKNIPAAYREGSKHPARRVFQALRIAVNDELTSLQHGVSSALAIVSKKGRVIVVSYHSLEDRCVKDLFKEAVDRGDFTYIVKHPVTAEDGEVARNPRAASAKLRAVEKL
ncbi:MAG: 16S rRNA (cytosine(1402)-N(4))-methyltransferase RsmH [Candidatus Dojkabacteria bacterium]|nr:16S rRNA (cytosine(1402)-N(4))-methyltransferase RsmH [Candidatus Dojkabacteria bacterium]